MTCAVPVCCGPNFGQETETVTKIKSKRVSNGFKPQVFDGDVSFRKRNTISDICLYYCVVKAVRTAAQFLYSFKI